MPQSSSQLTMDTDTDGGDDKSQATSICRICEEDVRLSQLRDHSRACVLCHKLAIKFKETADKIRSQTNILQHKLHELRENESRYRKAESQLQQELESLRDELGQ